MPTAEQVKWLNHLSDTAPIIIKPYDSRAPLIFQKVKEKVDQFFLGEITLEHHGATRMEISGQDEIDTYIPVPPDKFESYIPALAKLFGEPTSKYPERTKFVTIEDGKHVDIFLINRESPSWTNCVKFEDFLMTHPQSLEEYRKLKEEGNGINLREYYRRKIIFIEQILEKAG